MEASEFKILIRRAYGAMVRQAVGMLKDPDEAQEVVQQACISLWENIGRLSAADKPEAYCVRAVYHAAISRLRRERHFESLDNLASEPAEEAATSDYEYFETLLQQLPPQQYQAFMLRHRDELEYDEIAAQMGMRADNVRQLISRARKKLRELYGKDY